MEYPKESEKCNVFLSCVTVFMNDSIEKSKTIVILYLDDGIAISS